MRHKQTLPAVTPATNAAPAAYRWMVWLVFFAGSLFLLPQCLDRYLAPRFFFVSGVMLFGLLWLWRDLLRHGDRRLYVFEILLLGWYGLNLASVWWAFSWSEAVFYTQKVLLLVLAYAFVLAGLRRDEPGLRRQFARATLVLTGVVCGIVATQVLLSVAQNGLDNEKMYNYAIGVFGNKGLCSDFLFLLLVFNSLFYREYPLKKIFWLLTAVLLTLILVLQTRTVYLSVVAAAAIYFPLRTIAEPAFRPVFLKKILPAALLGLALLAVLIGWKGRGTTLAERLNPATYLESASANERRFVWYRTDQLNAEHFWWGVGNGSWKIWLPSKSLQGGYRLMEQNIVFTRAHNDYLEVQSEMGVIGLGLFLVLFGGVFFSAFAALRQQPDATARHDLPVLLAGIGGYCIIQFFDFPRERIEMQVLLGMLFAFTAWHARGLWQQLPAIPTGRLYPVLLALAAAGLVFNLVIGWNRIAGETNYIQLIRAHTAGRYNESLRAAQATKNAFYEYNDVTLPIEWYEGIAYYQTNRIDEAIAALEKAYALNPWNFQVLNNYASALAKKQRYREAIPFYEQAVNINPRYDDGKFNLAYCNLQLNDTNKALEWIARVDTIPNPPTEEDRRKNKAILEKSAFFRKNILEQSKGLPNK